MAIVMPVLIAIGTITKDLISTPRPRVPPSDFVIAANPDLSLPSGHTVIVSVGAYVVLTLFRSSNRRAGYPWG
jgi:PAP2 superfamily protein